ncbi:hypothetical protein BTVI_90410 [Pitangus sulphuratus]|nr:hypothetical protein BTVI_90410 [Pitangus sulphuratus]
MGPQGHPQPYGHQGRAMAPVPPVQDTQHSLASTANPSGAPLSSGGPPDTNSLVDLDTTPGGDINLGSDVSMDEHTFLRGDTSLPSPITPSHSAVLYVQAIRNPVVTPASDNVRRIHLQNGGVALSAKSSCEMNSLEINGSPIQW